MSSDRIPSRADDAPAAENNDVLPPPIDTASLPAHPRRSRAPHDSAPPGADGGGGGGHAGVGGGTGGGYMPRSSTLPSGSATTSHDVGRRRPMSTIFDGFSSSSSTTSTLHANGGGQAVNHGGNGAANVTMRGSLGRRFLARSGKYLSGVARAGAGAAGGVVGGATAAAAGSRHTSRDYDGKLFLEDDTVGGGGNGIRVWYESYTTIDWIHDDIKANARLRRIRRLRGARGFAFNAWDRVQGWVIVTLVGLITAYIASLIVKSEAVLFDLKDGYCARDWRLAKRFCCPYGGQPDWDVRVGGGPWWLPVRTAENNDGRRGSGAGLGLGSAAGVVAPRLLQGWAAPVAGSPAWRRLASAAQVSNRNATDAVALGEAEDDCPGWVTWAQALGGEGELGRSVAEYGMYFGLAIALAGVASLLTIYLTSSELYVSTKDAQLPEKAQRTAAQQPPPPPPPQTQPSHQRPFFPAAADSPQFGNSGAPSPVNERTPLLGGGANGVSAGAAAAAAPTTTGDSTSATALGHKVPSGGIAEGQPPRSDPQAAPPTTRKVLYFGSGSGISEIKVILSGFVIHGYLGFWTLFTKSVGLTLSVASGLSLGKEGPFVHIASCVGNIVSRHFPKFDYNESKRREVISCACAAGVAVAFGAPVGGVLFSLEEVSYYFPAKVMFRSFFCAMVAAATLRFLDPFGTGKIVLFEVTYDKDWHFYELLFFVIIGLFGGIYGAYFTKLNMAWSKHVRAKTWMAKHPLWEVVMITVLSAGVSYLNDYTRMGGPELIANLFAECRAHESLAGLCISRPSEIGPLVRSVAWALLAKAALTVVTFGIKLPAGIFIPTLAVGACFGRIVGLLVQYVQWTRPELGFFGWCEASDSACIVPGVYAMVGAASTLAGVTRTTVSLVVIMFELTGTLTYAVPVMLSVLVARTVADALEHEGIYDLVLRFSGLPYLDAKKEYTWDGVSILDAMDTGIEVIALEANNTVESLRQKLDRLALGSGYTDGGFPIVVRAGGGTGGGGGGGGGGTAATSSPLPSGHVAHGGASTYAAPSPALTPLTARERLLDHHHHQHHQHMSMPSSPVTPSAARFAGATPAAAGAGWRMVGYIAAQELEHGLSTLMQRHEGEMDASQLECTFHHLPKGDGLFGGGGGGAEDGATAHLAGSGFTRLGGGLGGGGSLRDSLLLAETEPEDLSVYVDKAPITVTAWSPLELVHQYFVRLGVRYLVVTGEGGVLRGIIFKKRWLAFLESLESGTH